MRQINRLLYIALLKFPRLFRLCGWRTLHRSNRPRSSYLIIQQLVRPHMTGRTCGSQRDRKNCSRWEWKRNESLSAVKNIPNAVDIRNLFSYSDGGIVYAEVG